MGKIIMLVPVEFCIFNETSNDVTHAVTLKWLPIVFVRFTQSQCIVTFTAKYGTTTATYYHESKSRPVIRLEQFRFKSYRVINFDTDVIIGRFHLENNESHSNV
jgi:hypothetical protein